MFGLDLKDARLDLELLGLVVDLLRLLAEGEDRKDSRDDGEHGEHRCSYGGELGREDERHGGRLRGGEPLGAASLELGSGDVGPHSRFRVRKLVSMGESPGLSARTVPGDLSTSARAAALPSVVEVGAMTTASRYATLADVLRDDEASCPGRGLPTRPSTNRGVPRTARRGRCWRTRGTESASCSHARGELLLIVGPGQSPERW